jgi:hypothetical protein
MHYVIAQVGQLLPTDPNAAPPIPGLQGLPQVGAEAWTTQAADALTNAISQGWDQTWNGSVSGPLYGVLARLGLLIAGFVIIFFMFQLTRDMIEDTSNRPLAGLIWPLVVVVFLSNNGSLLGGFTLGMRGFINQQNSQILRTTSAGLSAQAALNRIANFQSAQAQLGALQSACDDQRDNEGLERCLRDVQKQANQVLAQTSNGEIAGAWLQKLQKNANSVVQNPLQAAGNAAKAATGFALRAQLSAGFVIAQGILLAAQAAFQSLVEASFLLTGLMGPIALGASLLPFGAKPIWAWLTGFWSVGLCKISLNILTGLVAQATYQAGPLDPLGLILPITLGVLSPILAIAMATGGGMAIFNGLTSAGTTALSIVGSGLVRLK